MDISFINSRWSHSTWVYLMKSKYEVRPLLKQFFALTGNQFWTTNKILHTNNGLVFIMPEFYASKGVIHQLSCVEIPQQNGVVEWKYQCILNVAGSLYFQDNLLAKTYGLIAFNSCLPHKLTTYSNLTRWSSFELLFSMKPPYKHLCLAVCGLPPLSPIITPDLSHKHNLAFLLDFHTVL